MPATDSAFSIVNILRIDTPFDNERTVYFDIDGAYSQTAQVPCLPTDTYTIFSQAAQNVVSQIAAGIVGPKEFTFSSTAFPNPAKLVTIAATTKRPA